MKKINSKKEFIKNSISQLHTIIITVLITSTISVTAASIMVDSSQVAYNNERAFTVKDAIDTLYDSVEIQEVLPIGSIVPFMGTTAPTNYLICNGQTYNISDYKKIADHIKANFGSYNYFGGNGTTTFAVPDLRGEFLRGAGTNSHTNQGSGASVGQHQDATEIPYIGSFTTGAQIRTRSDGQHNAPQNMDAQLGTSLKWSNTSMASEGTETGYNLFSTRPTNTSVNYIIKAR